MMMSQKFFFPLFCFLFLFLSFELIFSTVCFISLLSHMHDFQQKLTQMPPSVFYAFQLFSFFTFLIDFNIFFLQKKKDHWMRIFATTTISIVWRCCFHCAITYSIDIDFACIKCGRYCCCSYWWCFCSFVGFSFFRWWPLKSLNWKRMCLYFVCVCEWIFATKESNHAYLYPFQCCVLIQLYKM